MKQMLLSLAALPLAACIAPYSAPLPVPFGPPPFTSATAMVTIGFGGTAMVNGVALRPLAVVEDSRCPINVQCVWAGRLVVRTRLTLRGGAEARETDFTLGVPQTIPGGILTLVRAEPPKIAEATSPPASLFTYELRSGG